MGHQPSDAIKDGRMLPRVSACMVHLGSCKQSQSLLATSLTTALMHDLSHASLYASSHIYPTPQPHPYPPPLLPRPRPSDGRKTQFNKIFSFIRYSAVENTKTKAHLSLDKVDRRPAMHIS